MERAMGLEAQAQEADVSTALEEREQALVRQAQRLLERAQAVGEAEARKKREQEDADAQAGAEAKRIAGVARDILSQATRCFPFRHSCHPP